MSKLAVPFYPNHEDNLHCMLAVYQSIFDSLLNRKLGWPEMEELTGFEPQKAAWSVGVLTYLARFLNIKMIEPFDYSRYARDGEVYLTSLFNDEELQWQLENTNILAIRPLIPGFLERVHPSCRRPTLSDIDAMLDEGRIVFAIVNANSLNDMSGYTAHAILILDKTDTTYTFHDPGLPPRPYRTEKKEVIYRAMGTDKTTSEVTGFKKKSTTT